MSTQIEFVPVDLIDPHPHNPRHDLGDLSEIAASIKAQGIRQNLVITPWGGEGRYRAIVGHRRLAAAKVAGLTEVPAVIDEEISAEEQIELMLLENVQREGISPMEEAEGYQQLLDLGVKPKDIVRMTGRSATTVHARLQLLKLPEDARQKVHLRQASLEDAGELEKLVKHADEYERVAKALGTSNFDFELKNARTRIARDEKLAPLYAEAERLGAVRGEWDYRRQDRVGDAATVEQVAALAPFPAGTIYGPASYSPFIYLFAPKSAEALAEAEERSRLVAAVTSPEARAARDEEYRRAQEERAAVEAEGAQAWELREEFVVTFTGRKRILAKESLAIVAAAGPVVVSQELYVDVDDVAEWLGLEDHRLEPATVMAAFDERCPSLDRSLCLLVALHVATKNAYWGKAYDDAALVALYSLLEHLGYPVSDAERARITPPTDEEVE